MKPRNRLNTLNIPGLFQDVETSLSVFIKIYDVSDKGLGVFSADQLTPGQELVWITLQGEVHFKVQWCNQEASGDRSEDGFGFRAGLECLGSCENLYDLIRTVFDTKGIKKA